MLMTRSDHSPAPPRGEDGFTLIEVLVVMISGIVVTGALVIILIISFEQSIKIQDASTANQLGRTTMTKIVDPLHSACLAEGFQPISAKSTASTLRFTTAYSEKNVIASSEASEHEVEWVAASEAFTEKVYPATSGEGSSFVFSTSPATTTRIGEHITQASETSPQIFRYFRYTTSASAGSESGASDLAEIPASELSTKAGEVAAVSIAFRVASGDKSVSQKGIPAEFNNQVIFAFSAPASETTLKDSPCH
jgi:Tfp pilus assembly protein PilW